MFSGIVASCHMGTTDGKKQKDFQRLQRCRDGGVLLLLHFWQLHQLLLQRLAFLKFCLTVGELQSKHRVYGLSCLQLPNCIQCKFLVLLCLTGFFLFYVDQQSTFIPFINCDKYNLFLFKEKEKKTQRERERVRREFNDKMAGHKRQLPQIENT